MGLIPNKITIPSEAMRGARLRLHARLDECLKQCSVTVINGRAGTGKTTLAAEFARQAERRVAWYKVDAPDAEWRTFLRYLIASIAGQRPRFGNKLLSQLLEPTDEAGLVTLAEAFVYDLQKQDEPLLVVIDDLHLIYDAGWIAPFFQRLLPLLPQEVHLLLLCRSLPPAPLWRLRSKQRLCVIDEAELAFTAEEAAELFAAHGLTAEQAQSAWTQTRGRAAALYVEVERATTVEAAA
jgi:LuxR family transcriptional regulator, maltose regulon positive regulatory protein